MVKALAAAKYLIRKFAEDENPISHLKLQKILYYSQAWHLALFDKALFDDPIQAWVHGPVVPSVFQQYRGCRWSAITEASDPRVAAKAARHLDNVVSSYGHLSALQLERLSHSEEPWQRARQGLSLSDPSTAVISHESMRDYFSQMANA